MNKRPEIPPSDAADDDVVIRTQSAARKRAAKNRTTKSAGPERSPKGRAEGARAKKAAPKPKKKAKAKPKKKAAVKMKAAVKRKAAPAKKTVKKKAAVKKKVAKTKAAPRKRTAAKKKAVKKKAAPPAKKIVKKKAAASRTTRSAGPERSPQGRVEEGGAAEAPKPAPTPAPTPTPARTVGKKAAGTRRKRPTSKRRGDERRPEAPPAPIIPPLPEEEEEIVPYEETEPAAAAREAPEGTAPARILEGIRRGELHVSALGALDDAQIVRLARDQGLKVHDRERRSETLYRLLQGSPRARRPQNVFVEGLLELHPDGYGFLRNPERNYTQHPEDVYVAAGLVRKLGLKAGHWLTGTARQSRPGEPLLALQSVDEVNHESARELQKVTPFENLTVVFPDTRFLLEVAPEDLEMRVIDLFCPLGRGQRALIVSPPRAGKTVILQKLADAIAHNSPDVDIVVLLVDERPEEVTNMRRSVRGEVIASTFDRPAANHIRVAELVMEKVKRMVEYGRHVVLLLDSITRLGRAYNNTSGPSGRILTGGLEAKALTKPKRFFGAARNIEDGGSLTIVATALVETGSRMDDVIFEEFKGSGNMEIVLDRGMANARIWPAIDLPASGTRNEDLLLHPEELRRVNLMRKAMSGQDALTVMDGLREQMMQYRTNAELLMSVG